MTNKCHINVIYKCQPEEPQWTSQDITRRCTTMGIQHNFFQRQSYSFVPLVCVPIAFLSSSPPQPQVLKCRHPQGCASQNPLPPAPCKVPCRPVPPMAPSRLTINITAPQFMTQSAALKSVKCHADPNGILLEALCC